jgi:hypothetical protein
LFMFEQAHAPCNYITAEIYVQECGYLYNFRTSNHRDVI